jgi:hypothetical protein
LCCGIGAQGAQAPETLGRDFPKQLLEQIVPAGRRSVEPDLRLVLSARGFVVAQFESTLKLKLLLEIELASGPRRADNVALQNRGVTAWKPTLKTRTATPTRGLGLLFQSRLGASEILQ